MWGTSSASDGAISSFARASAASSASSSSSSSTTSGTASNSDASGVKPNGTGMWAYAPPPPGIVTSATTAPSFNHGTIGSTAGTASRLLWSRSAPEEEEREEEALPSYLSYLQPSFATSSDRLSGLSSTGAMNASSGGSFANSSSALPLAAAPPVSSSYYSAMSSSAPMYVPGGAAPQSTTHVEVKSKELAHALQDFIMSQIETKSSSSGSNAPPSSSCNCDAMKMRVSDLEQQVQTLQMQVAAVLKGGMGNTITHGMQPPLPPNPSSSGSVSASTPPYTPPLPSSPSAQSLAASAAMSDRVSTLEGRQSAFQSQLAQISKVLGVPVGKHGKNSQVKNLVQTLRDEIDAKIQSVATETETKCVELVQQEMDACVDKSVQAALQNAQSPSSTAASGAGALTPSSSLSYEAVLGALAEEHEASLAKLSTYFDERLLQESKQRVGLEGRIQTRFGEHEEWLQQLEGEFGSWHDTSSSVASQIRTIHAKLTEMDEKWRTDQLKWTKQLSELPVVAPAANSNASPTGTKKSKNSSGNGTVSATTNGNHQTTLPSLDALTRTVHQLQIQHKNLQSEVKTESAGVREQLALIETWVETTRTETRDLSKTTKGMKQLVEKLVRDTGSAEELLQQYVSTITHQVASVTRQYVSVRIRDNNRLIDATLRARVPAYVANESESFMLVRPEKKDGEDSHTSGASSSELSSTSSAAAVSFVLRDNDEEGIRKLLAEHVGKAGELERRATAPLKAPAAGLSPSSMS